MTNALDGSEDYLVLDELFTLIRDEMVDFRKEFMSQKFCKNFKIIYRQSNTAQVKEKANVEGSELLDCEGEETSLEEFQ